MKIDSLYIIAIATLFFTGCKFGRGDTADTGSAAPIASVKTDVMVANPTDTAQLRQSVTLNATASYLLKSDAKSNATGYITEMNIRLADPVYKGQTLFAIETKEARALGNTISRLDESFRFHGKTKVVSPTTGYVAMLNHQIGDYVQDGEILATITDIASFGFIVDVPFEYLHIIKSKKLLPISLPDGSMIQGNIKKIMPSADIVSQTVKVLLQVARKDIPENLIGTITFYKTTAYGLAVPKTAVLSDEAQTNFWVMRLLNDSTAVKTPIEKGIETDKFIQVTSEHLTTNDRVVVSGNFGLGDTASVKIQTSQN